MKLHWESKEESEISDGGRRMKSDFKNLCLFLET